MCTLKRITLEGVGRAIRKAERYRLLGEPLESESICMDVLEVDPGNHEARVLLILALTDQFRSDPTRVGEASKLAREMEEDYERFYYSGIVAERVGKVQLTKDSPSSDDYANRALREAMEWYERAEALRPPGDDDAIARWNTCVRAIARRGFSMPRDTAFRGPVMTE